MMTDYSDNDLVYVDPNKKEIVGRVEWTKDGVVKPLEMKENEELHKDKDDDPKKQKRRPRKRNYPWGTFRSIKKLYKTHGKEKEVENYKTFNDALERALQEPFWD